MPHSKRWLVSPPITAAADTTLAGFPPVLRQLLVNRRIFSRADAEVFLKAEVGTDTSPWQMTGMRASVERIFAAIERNEPVVVYGDYDVDGVTATALLVQTLQALGAQASGYIPNRFDEGYGLNKDALSHLKEDGVGLVISVDCGIRSPDEAEHAASLGLDLIITDHHHPAEELPPALAVINPKQEGDLYPDKDLAGVGVAFKLAQALLERRPVEGFLPDDLLDLVALGTVADLAPLTGENRMLVRKGLECIRATRRQGLFALANVSGVTISRTVSTNIGFGFGPRLNAAGRLESALAAYTLLTTKDIQTAGELALKLDVQNRERQAITRRIQEEAEKMVLADARDAYLFFAASPDFNSGVVGLAAARLSEMYYRPAIVGQISEETTRCSCRSIHEFHITRALDQCADLLVRHGGHAAAAGFTVKNENVPALVTRLKSLAAEQLRGLDLRPTIPADAEVVLPELGSELYSQLELLQPTGYGNPEPLFVTRSVQVKVARSVGSEGQHLKLTVTDGRVSFDCIAFKLGHLLPGLPPRIDIIYAFEINEFNGRTNFQLNVKDIKAAGVPD